ncbi:hypothetical protein [Variovorax sp. MHTC-1]|nr:hypothetical protein [Variovorax sp. MHTC-1]
MLREDAMVIAGNFARGLELSHEDRQRLLARAARSERLQRLAAAP